jgi:DNA-binding beta-propeller fold protein YncE
MRFLRKPLLAVVLFSILLWAGCGDTFRPVVIPTPPAPPDSSNFRAVFVVNSNGPANPGTGMQIDVSGDTNVGTAKLGLGPVHAAVQPSGTAHVLVANSLDDTVASFAPAPPCSAPPCPVSALGTVSFSSLPAGSTPVFVHTTENNTVYVANAGTATVAVISINSNVVTNIIPVGANPVALAETPDARKLYAVNQGGSSVTSINPLDKSINMTITDPTIIGPVWAVARADSARVYVLSSQGNGNLAVIDTFTDTLVPNSISVGAGANFMLYDKTLNRLYITNPTANTLTIVDAAADPPKLVATLNLTTGLNPLCPVGCLSVTALPDGSRAYVASAQESSTCPTGMSSPCLISDVTVINASSNSITKTISLPTVPVVASCASTAAPAIAGTRFRISTASAGDSSRVYVGNCDAGNISIIRTLDDTPVLSLPAPVSAGQPPPGSTQPPPQNPVFVVAGP